MRGGALLLLLVGCSRPFLHDVPTAREPPSTSVQPLGGVTVTVPSATSVRLDWSGQDRNPETTGYRIARRDPGAGSFTTVMEVAADVSTYDDTGLERASVYVYRLFVRIGASESPPIEVVEHTPMPPQLLWRDPATFEAGCALRVGGETVFDHGATLADASGTIGKATAAPVADDAGLVATLTDLALGSFDVSWTVSDSFGGSSTRERTLRLGLSSALHRSAARRPALGERRMEGDQALLPPCATCTGSRASLVTGAFHTCALTDAGRVECWGANDVGQLGDGTDTWSDYPVLVCTSGAGAGCTPLEGVVAIAAGGWHSCALLDTGRVSCWGYNYEAELGNGGYDDSWLATPVCATGTAGSCVPLDGVVALSASDNHSCAIVAGGEMRCWGFNSCGQLGNGATPFCDDWLAETNPVTVCDGTAGGCTPLAGVVEIGTGELHTCALTAAGGVLCWGSGTEGQLGAGALVDSGTPVPVLFGSETGSPLDGAVALSVGDDHACVVTADGGIQCWGCNELWCEPGNPTEAGALGMGLDDGFYPFASPVCDLDATSASCRPLTGAIAVTAGEAFTCALLSSGNPVCWGDGTFGQGGWGYYDSWANTPLQVCAPDRAEQADGCDSWFGDAVAIAAGDDHVCALRSDGTIYCWGEYETSVPAQVCDAGSGETCEVQRAVAVQSCQLYGVAP
jgi:alpha-tubulin suppressor-like RCC1 family protein